MLSGKKCLAIQVVAMTLALCRSNPATAGEIPQPFNWVAIAAHNSSHACALANNGGIACWGQNWNGELGNPYIKTGYQAPGASANIAVPVLGLPGPAKSIAVGSGDSCAIMAGDGSVWCWGDNGSGQLGNGQRGQSINSVPQKVVGLQGPAVSVSIGFFHTCAVLASGQTSCWGLNADVDVLGDPSLPSYTYELTPHLVPGLNGASAVSASSNSTCVIDRNPQWVAGKGLSWVVSPVCWGENGSAQSGQPNVPNSGPVPPSIMYSLSDLQSIAAGNDFACAVSATQGLRCWGADASFGSLGDNLACLVHAPDGKDCATAQSVVYFGGNPGGYANTVAAGGGTGCVLLTNGTVWCWGDNLYGQIGTLNPKAPSTSFYAVKAFTYPNATGIAVGGDFACAIVNEGSNIQCWGRNDYGQLGDGTYVNNRLPQWVQ